jgi:hypothetical protein
MTAKFQHVCDDCRFLGHYQNADLYFCGPEGMPAVSSTVIARFSDEASDYVSGLPIGQIPLLDHCATAHLRVAYLIARDMGLLGPARPTTDLEHLQRWLFDTRHNLCYEFKEDHRLKWLEIKADLGMVELVFNTGGKFKSILVEPNKE